jgi:hypothetical protein
MAETDDVLRALAEAATALNQRRILAAPPNVSGELLSRPVPRQPYPPCMEVLLSLVPTDLKDFVREDFDDYFTFEAALPDVSDAAVAGVNPALVALLRRSKLNWLPECCSCLPLVVLKGKRNLPPPGLEVDPRHRRIYAGDIIWLFYYERMGIFKILGALLDDYATRGQFPISSGAIDPTSRDDNAAQVLEIMVQQLKSGSASSVRERDSSYRRVVGWTSDVGRQVGSTAIPNPNVDALLKQVVKEILAFYRDRRLAQAIQGTISGSTPPTTSTLTAIGDTLRLLKQHLERFDYGRNYYNVLNGIVWVIAGIALVRELRSSLGIPIAYDSPHEYIPAAYELLVAGRSASNADPNRFTVHRTCARNGRDLLMDIDGLTDADLAAPIEGGPLDAWLRLVETKVEGYRTAYQTLTGLDLAQTITTQQAV